jgi:hypothetical protein
MNTRVSNRGEIDVGDRILIMDRSLGESQPVSAEVLEIRRILGRLTFLVETQIGHRKLVGEAQIYEIE